MVTHPLKDIQHNFERAITPFHLFDSNKEAFRIIFGAMFPG